MVETEQILNKHAVVEAVDFVAENAIDISIALAATNYAIYHLVSKDLGARLLPITKLAIGATLGVGGVKWVRDDLQLDRFAHMLPWR